MLSMSRRDLMKALGLGAAAVSLGGALGPSAGGEEPSEEAPKAYELPDLPYAYDALEPQIEERVLRVHHGKHHAGYVSGLNKTLGKLKEARAGGDFSQIKALSRDLAFHGSGHVLHSLYWESMTPGGSGQPTGELLTALEQSFGSLAVFKAQFLAATKAVEGSGWGLLAYEPMGRRLVVLQAENHQNLTVWGVLPLLACDVWEHAYYVQYQNRRTEYVDRFFTLIDWPGLARRYVAAVS